MLTGVVDLDRLRTDYYARTPDLTDRAQRVAFGTSGHRGSSLRGSFNEAHVLAITQAICEYRKSCGVDGPLYLGKDTHALSEPAFRTTLELLAANRVDVMIPADDGYTPTPAISRAILSYNRGRTSQLADGIIITPSHNPPEDGGFKYNPPTGGPAEVAATRWIETRANGLLARDLNQLPRCAYDTARQAPTTHTYDYVGAYVDGLASVIDMASIRRARLKIGVDPLGGASLGYWRPIADRFDLDLEVVTDRVDPTFGFMPRDWDGRIRMDCSSPHAMATLIGMKDRFDIAFGNDPDADRHGIVTRRGGLMPPNAFLATAVKYLFTHRAGWRSSAAVGKTVVSSSLIDRVAARLRRTLIEVPVGFKWFVPGLLDGSLGFGGEESAGASFLCRDGSVWTTDKDGIAMALLAVELTARTGRDPFDLYEEITRELGSPAYERIDAPITAEAKTVLSTLSPGDISATELGGDRIDAVLTAAPGNGVAIGGLKVVTAHGWFAVRPSGTEEVYKLSAESFRGPAHLRRIQEEARAIVDHALASVLR